MIGFIGYEPMIFHLSDGMSIMITGKLDFENRLGCIRSRCYVNNSRNIYDESALFGQEDVQNVSFLKYI